MCVCMRVHAWVGVGVLYRGLLQDSLENDFRGKLKFQVSKTAMQIIFRNGLTFSSTHIMSYTREVALIFLFRVQFSDYGACIGFQYTVNCPPVVNEKEICV